MKTLEPGCFWPRRLAFGPVGAAAVGRQARPTPRHKLFSAAVEGALLLLFLGATCLAGGSYFPPPEREGGWRTLVPPNTEPSTEQKQTIRERTGLDWDKLAEAWRYTASFGTPNNLLIIRHGWIAGDWTNFASPRGIASCTKSLTALAMAKLFDLSDAGQLPKRIGVDDEAWRFLPETWSEAEPARKRILLRHLLTMTSGLTPYVFYMSGWGKQACFVAPSLDMVLVRLGPDKKLNEHPEFYPELWKRVMAGVVDRGASSASAAAEAPSVRALPFDGHAFHGRIAWSADGNFNDEDDWGASPMALAIYARCGVTSQLVHFDYNSILYDNNSQWANTHEKSVLGAAERFGFRKEIFYDCQRNLDAAVNSIAAAVNASSSEDPLWFVLAGPMEAPLAGLRKANAAKLPFVYCISHSRWNDGFDPKSGSRFKFNKRSIIALGVHWVQIRDQNEFLSTSRYGAVAREADWQPWLWMRDSSDADVRWLWERLRAVTRDDCSDAGMARFLMTGDEENSIPKLRELIDERKVTTPVVQRRTIRLEAENFRDFAGVELEYKNDRLASQRLNVKLAGGRNVGRIETQYDEPYTADAARFDIEVRYCADRTGASRYALLLNGAPAGPGWQDDGSRDTWRSHVLPDVLVRRGDRLGLVLESDHATVRADYIDLKAR